MLIVADSSALVALATCDALELLSALYDDVKVPQAVLMKSQFLANSKQEF